MNLFEFHKMIEETLPWWTDIVLPIVGMVLVGILLLLSGCTPTQQVVYGYRGPAIQDDIYHPMQDPLFREDK